MVKIKVHELAKKMGISSKEAIEKAKESSKKDKQEIISAYTSAKNEAKDDAIKRGLARSSIIVNTLASYDKGMLENLESEAKELESAISGYESERNLLEEQKNSALASFDIEYAVKLQDKILQVEHTQLEIVEAKKIEEKQYEAALIAKGIPAENIRKYGFAFEGKKVLIG